MKRIYSLILFVLLGSDVVQDMMFNGRRSGMR